MRRIMQYLFLLTPLSCWYIQTGHAAEMQVSSATFNPNDSSISVSVTLLNNSSNQLSLAAFSFELQVSPVSPRSVEFDASTQPDSLTNNNYVFFGNSAAANTPTTPWSVNSIGGGVNNGFVFSDTTDTTFNVNVAANTSKLLANILMVPGSGSAKPQAGDSFTLSFVSAGTSIFDENLNPIAFTTGTGTLTVPVPEPSSYAMAGLGFAIITFVRRRRSR